jgi:predicted nucleic acid-binding protein
VADVYFADTSALSKRYVTETGTTWIQATLDPSTGCSVYIARITAVELIAAITRRERGATLTPSNAAAARSAFRAHLGAEYKAIEVTESLLNRAMTLAEMHGLRGYDAVQLAAALDVNASYRAVGIPPITLVSADVELNTAAITEGLAVEDPNTHP